MNVKWEAEATALSEEVDLEEFVFRNQSVDMFISGGKTFKSFVIAAKGMGKTLLLHYRRHICENNYAGAVFLPSSHQTVDFPEDIKLHIKKETMELLENYDFCKRFWALVLKLYVLNGIKTSYEEVCQYLKLSDEKNYSFFLKQLLDGESKSISFVINGLLNFEFNRFVGAIDVLANEIKPLFDRIHTPVFVFLDQLDQALSDNHKKIWITMQNALLDAAWDISRINRHVRVFLSIRKEAFAFLGKQSANANAIQSSVVLIEYSKEDLKQMTNHLVNYYDAKKDVYDFYDGNKTFKNVTTGENEDVFDFMFRYSVGRPRDFVEMCYGISSQSFSKEKKKKRDELKRSICRTASDKIISGLYREQKILLNCFDTEERFIKFLKMLKKNVFSYSEVVEICKLFNQEACCGDCKKCSEQNHPFCDLYNMGLLGIIDKEGDEKEQLFKTPYSLATLGLIESDYYLIHPALREYISHLNVDYHLVTGILVGHQSPWLPEYDLYYAYDILLGRLPDKDIREKYRDCLIQYIGIKRKKSKTAKDQELKLPSNVTKPKKVIDALNNYLKEDQLIMPQINIFISYASGNSEETENIIDSLRDQLRKNGYNAEHYKSVITKEPDLDKLMKKYIKKSDKVIVVLSKEYKEKTDNSVGGVWREYQMIRDEIEENPNKYILVCIESFDKKTMYPEDLGNKWVIEKIRTPKAYNTLISFINDTSEYSSEISDTVIQVKQKETIPFFINE